MHRIVPLLILPLVALATACGHSAPALGPDVKDPVRRAYYDGMRALVDGDYLEASQSFQLVASSPRTSKYAALAKLRLGDALFFQDRYAEATEIYRGFTNQYKSDPNLPYARFRVSQCYYERIPGEWFASPPAHEMDQTLTQQAEAELKGFLSQFPTSRYAPDARRMLREAREMLLRAELYVVDFYADREQWQAVAWRLSDAVATYPELATTQSRVWQLVEAWTRVGDGGETARALGLYIEKFPDGAHHDEALRRIEAIRQTFDRKPPREPEEAPAPPRPEPPPADDGGGADAPSGDDDLELRPPTLPPLEEP